MVRVRLEMGLCVWNWGWKWAWAFEVVKELATQGSPPVDLYQGYPTLLRCLQSPEQNILQAAPGAVS